MVGGAIQPGPLLGTLPATWPVEPVGDVDGDGLSDWLTLEEPDLGARGVNLQVVRGGERCCSTRC